MMCSTYESKQIAADNLTHAKTFVRTAWMNIRNIPELKDDRNKLFDIVTLLDRLRNKFLRTWKLSFQNDYEHIKGEYKLTRYLGSDYWSLTLGEKDLARTLTAAIGYEEARLWADSEIIKYETKINKELGL